MLKKIIQRLRRSKIQKIAGIIVFRKTATGIKFLLLKHHKSGWGFSKGKLERKESLLMASKRELFEETGLKNVEYIKGFSEIIEYTIGKKNGQKLIKRAQYFLVKAKKKKIVLSDEHLDFRWLEYSKAIRILPFKNLKILLKKANKIISINIKRKK